MAFMVWQEQYSVHIPEIDQQHQRIIYLLNQLCEAVEKDQADDLLGSFLVEVIACFGSHFSSEERMMREARYPGLDSHQEAHSAFMADLNGFYQDYKRGNAQLSLAVLTRIKDWLDEHMVSTDQLYIDHLHRHGIR